VKPSVEGEGDTKMSSLFMTWVRSETYFVPKEFGPLQIFLVKFCIVNMPSDWFHPPKQVFFNDE